MRPTEPIVCTSVGGAARRCLISIIIAALIALAEPASAQEVHVNVRGQIGGTDAEYPSCNGAALVFLGGSVEIGQPLFVEVLGEAMASGGDACLPGRLSSDGSGAFVGAVLTDPSARASAGVGRTLANQRISIVARGGRFLNTREEFGSMMASVRLSVLTAGLEVGKVHARWLFEDGTKYRRWSTFGGVSLGLRILRGN